jgi:hypothetical protein
MYDSEVLEIVRGLYFLNKKLFYVNCPRTTRRMNVQVSDMLYMH